MNNVDFFVGTRDKNIVAKAKSLGFDSVFFVKEASSVEDIKKDDDYDAVLIKTSNVELMRRMADKSFNSSYLVVVFGINDDINRAALENKKVNMLLLEHSRNKDYMNYRNSGLNHVLCKISHDNNKIIAVSFNEIFNKKDKDRAIALGRVMQNVMLCRKYKAEIRCYNFASKIDEIKSAHYMKSFCSAIGMATSQIKKVLSF